MATRFAEGTPTPEISFEPGEVTPRDVLMVIVALARHNIRSHLESQGMTEQAVGKELAKLGHFRYELDGPSGTEALDVWPETMFRSEVYDFSFSDSPNDIQLVASNGPNPELASRLQPFMSSSVVELRSEGDQQMAVLHSPHQAAAA